MNERKGRKEGRKEGGREGGREGGMGTDTNKSGMVVISISEE